MAGQFLTASAGAQAVPSLPWRGPGEDRPDLPAPDGHMPLFQGRQLRKQWRYVGFYGDEVMLCAAVATIGVVRHCFWSIWDRSDQAGEVRVFEHTQMRPGRSEVTLEGSKVQIRTAEVNADLVLGDSDSIEVFSPSGRSWGWTRKRAGVPIRGRIELPGKTLEVDGFGVDDESAGYHARHTAWYWSAGIGVAADGRRLGWNLVEGINDSVTDSERAIWVDGEPYEPGPVSFKGLGSVVFSESSAPGASSAHRPTLEFEFSGAERRRKENFGLIRSTYIHRFGTFSGSLDGIELAAGSGVMEEHDVFW